MNRLDTTNKRYSPQLAGIPLSQTHMSKLETLLNEPPIATTGNAPMANMISEHDSVQTSNDDFGDPSSGVVFDESGCNDSLNRDKIRRPTAKGMADARSDAPEDKPLALDPLLVLGNTKAMELSSNQRTHNSSTIFNQPSSSLVSPPLSSHENVGESPMAAGTTPTKSQSSSRGTSQPPQENFQRYTPESGPIRKVSYTSSRIPSVEQEVPKAKKHRTSIEDADLESIKLIKELQAQDLGLRRRAKV